MRALLFLPALILFCLPLLRSRREDRKEDPDELPRVVISQQVPSVFDAIRGKRK